MAPCDTPIRGARSFSARCLGDAGCNLEKLGTQCDELDRCKRQWLGSGAGQAAPTTRRIVDVPLSFAPGEAYRFDWSHEIVVLSGMTVTSGGRRGAQYMRAA